MIRPGAKGSLAYFSSNRTKRVKSTGETHSGTRAIFADHERLLPRSKPRRSVKIAHTRIKAPGKSTRLSLAFQLEFSLLGSLRANVTLTYDKTQIGTCPRKALLRTC